MARRFLDVRQQLSGALTPRPEATEAGEWVCMSGVVADGQTVESPLTRKPCVAWSITVFSESEPGPFLWGGTSFVLAPGLTSRQDFVSMIEIPPAPTRFSSRVPRGCFVDASSRTVRDLPDEFRARHGLAPGATLSEGVIHTGDLLRVVGWLVLVSDFRQRGVKVRGDESAPLIISNRFF